MRFIFRNCSRRPLLAVLSAIGIAGSAIPTPIQAATTESTTLQAVKGAAASLAQLVATHVMPAAVDRETECVAAVVYHEAGNEPLDGQLAVADVVVNRVASGRFASSLCGVVFQPRQFSFLRGGVLPDFPRESPRWRRAVAVAEIARQKLWESSVTKALFFHASHISPGWKRIRIGRVGNHIFYR